MGNKFKGQRQWVREILNRFEEVEKLRPQPNGTDESVVPEWVTNLLVLLQPVSYPGLKLKNGAKWKARDLGRWLGRHYAVEHLMWGEVPLSPEVIRETQRGIGWFKSRWRVQHPDADLRKISTPCEAELKTWRPRFKRCIHEALASACDRPYLETSAFFEAFGKAIVVQPDDLLAERTTGLGDKIAWVMWVMWRDIERLESVAQLHRVLQRALKPRGIVVTYKRVEKLCQRIKLKFKDRGRPPGRKNQTNPQVL